MSDRVPAPPRASAKIAGASIPGSDALLLLTIFVVIVAAFYFARDVMMPITLAVLLSFVLAPLVNLLRRGYLPRVPAVLLSVILALGVILALAGLIGVQIANLAGNLPKYQYTIETKGLADPEIHRRPAVRSAEQLRPPGAAVGAVGEARGSRRPARAETGARPGAGAAAVPAAIGAGGADPRLLAVGRRRGRLRRGDLRPSCSRTICATA